MPRKTRKRISLALIGALAFWAVACTDGNAESAKPEPTSAASASQSTSTPKPNQGDNVGLNAIDAFIESRDIEKSSANWKTRLPQPPQVEFEEGKTYYWNLDTNVGAIKIKLLPEVAPMHVSSTST